jgi:xanthine dehydrogenase accessory factor
MHDLTVVIKGAGEMATGIAHRLYRSGITRIVMTEAARPIAVRRGVTFSEAVYEGAKEVEGVTARRIATAGELPGLWAAGEIGVIVDPEWRVVRDVGPNVVVDAIMLKRYTGTKKDEAELVIGVGPGFTAPEDVHVVIESNRGHDLGRLFYKGSAEPFTGLPGNTEGFRTERVLRAPHDGTVRHIKKLGDTVRIGEEVLYVGGTPVRAAIDGIVRGLIREIAVPANEKVGDIDPRARESHCYTISEKARAIGGGVLEAVLHHFNQAGRD